ncbi:MAG: type VI secretion system protein TssA [Wenzhouxiangella sp.]|nr:type VI secretion system protein TssA [Wenzhouxiangella sp.]TVR95961.1 MAG: type VI secretion system protein TssA [Wenzhouxiangellaceae bacterium]
MSDILDIDRLLQPVSEDHPCGDDLDDFVFSPEFGELQRLGQGREEHVMGDEVIPAEEPDWRAVRKAAEDLFGTVKSLRVAVLLTKAVTVRDGLPGMAAGLGLIRAMLERYWDQVDPLIEDDGDATERMHTLGELGTVEGFIRLVRRCELVASQAIGRFTLRDYLIASDHLEVPAGEQAPQLSTINQALMDTEIEALQATISALDKVLEHASAIEALFNEKVSAADQLSLTEIVRLGRHVRPAVQEALERRGIVAAASGEAAAAAAAGDGQPAAAPQVVAAPGEIHSREDVIKALDRISEWFNKNEPSSPIPLLMQRAKRLVSQDFMSILKDLAPDGLKQIEMISGSKKEK